jgi:hypothetical protein
MGDGMTPIYVLGGIALSISLFTILFLVFA